MNFEDVGISICKLYKDGGKKKEKKGKTLHVTHDLESCKFPFIEYECEKGEKLKLCPRGKERDCLYVTGPSGAGKSYFCAEYVKEYLKQFPNNNCYIFSTLTSDSNLDKIKKVKRVSLNEDFLNTQFVLSDFADSLVLYDDVDSIVSKPLKKKLFGILNNILQTGRHSSTTVLYTSHLACVGNDTKIILAEATSVTCFPKVMGKRQITYLLENYIGLSKQQVEEVRRLKTRPVTFIRGFPQVVLHDKGCHVINGEYL